MNSSVDMRTLDVKQRAQLTYEASVRLLNHSCSE